MSTRHRGARAPRVWPLAVLAGLVLAIVIVLPNAWSDDPGCDRYATITLAGGRYIVQNNEWNSSSPQCIASQGGTGWTVSTANQNAATDGPPASYPSIYSGCHWGSCTSDGVLPIRVDRLPRVTSSWSTHEPDTGAYDTSYDVWFNTTPTASGQPDGAELMIWLNSRGGVHPAGSMVGTTSIDGATWQVWTTRMNGWNYIAYVRTPATDQVSDLDIAAFTRDAVSRNSVEASWYLIDVEAGFEIWQGGQGLTTDAFSLGISRRRAGRRAARSAHRAAAPAGAR